MSELEQQMRASLPFAKQINELRKENALLTEQLKLANLREERRVRESAGRGMFHRVQI